MGCDAAVIENNYGITPLDFQNNTGDVDEDIFIFQHPKGEPKKVSYQKISNIEPPYLFYKADTDVGSSGSPVLLKFKLIGIHSKGSDTLKYNKGTLCQEILQHLNNGTCECMGLNTFYVSLPLCILNCRLFGPIADSLSCWTLFSLLHLCYLSLLHLYDEHSMNFSKKLSLLKEILCYAHVCFLTPLSKDKL